MPPPVPKTRTRRGRHEGTLFKRSDGLWVGSISLGIAGGKRRRRTVYKRTKTEAAEALRELQFSADAGQLPGASSITVEGWLKRWLSLIESSVEKGTLIPYRRHVEKHIVPQIGGVRIKRLTPHDVEAFFSALLKAHVSAKMVRKIGTTLSVALNHAVHSRLIPSNPAYRVKRPKASKPEIEVMDADQVSVFVGACRGERHGPLFLLILDAGCRPGEALALTWKDIDFKARQISITKSLEEAEGVLRVKKPKTAHSIRSVNLTSATIAALNTHRQAMLAEGRDVVRGPVFLSVRGRLLAPSNLMRYVLWPILDRMKLPRVSVYALRHTCATLLLAANPPVNPKVVSERLGHSSVTLTLDTYSHVLPTIQKGAVDALEKALGGK